MLHQHDSILLYCLALVEMGRRGGGGGRDPILRNVCCANIYIVYSIHIYSYVYECGWCTYTVKKVRGRF